MLKRAKIKKFLKKRTCKSCRNEKKCRNYKYLFEKVNKEFKKLLLFKKVQKNENIIK